MFNAKTLPTLMIFLMLGASVVYYVKGDIRHGTYWLSGAILNISVTY